jgi:transcriptional regulator with XRE-family HTH domain
VITETQIINSNIKNIRKRLGKTQAQVAAAINMDRSYYSRKESKKENGIKSLTILMNVIRNSI